MPTPIIPSELFSFADKIFVGEFSTIEGDLIAYHYKNDRLCISAMIYND